MLIYKTEGKPEVTKEEAKEEAKTAAATQVAAGEADARVQVVFAAEVARINEGITRLAAECLDEGKHQGHTAERALENFHAKVKQFIGPWT